MASTPDMSITAPTPSSSSSGAAVPSAGPEQSSQTAWEYAKAMLPAIREEYERPGRAPREPVNGVVRKLMALPAVNQLTFNTVRRGGASATFALGTNPNLAAANLKAALVQTTGQPATAAQACKKCAELDGLWVGCVRAPAQYPNVIPAGCCANCYYNNHARACKAPTPLVYQMPTAIQPAGSLSQPTLSSSASASTLPLAAHAVSTSAVLAQTVDRTVADSAVQAADPVAPADAVMAGMVDASVDSSMGADASSRSLGQGTASSACAVREGAGVRGRGSKGEREERPRTPRRRRLDGGRYVSTPSNDDGEDGDEDEVEDDELGLGAMPAINIPASLRTVRAGQGSRVRPFDRWAREGDQASLDVELPPSPTVKRKRRRNNS